MTDHIGQAIAWTIIFSVIGIVIFTIQIILVAMKLFSISTLGWLGTLSPLIIVASILGLLWFGSAVWMGIIFLLEKYRS